MKFRDIGISHNNRILVLIDGDDYGTLWYTVEFDVVSEKKKVVPTRVDAEIDHPHFFSKNYKMPIPEDMSLQDYEIESESINGIEEFAIKILAVYFGFIEASAVYWKPYELLPEDFYSL